MSSILFSSLFIYVCPWHSRWDALPEMPPAHGAEAHPGRLRLQSGVHLFKCGGSEHPQRQTRGNDWLIAERLWLTKHLYNTSICCLISDFLVCVTSGSPAGGEEGPRHLDQEEQRDSPDEPRVKH